MRILHVINSLGGSGGAEHGLVREITLFDPEVEQLVVRLYSKDQLDERIEGAGVTVTTLGLRSKFGGYNWPMAAWRLSRIVKEFRPDVLHSSLFSANLVAQLVSRISHVPLLATFTNSGDATLIRALQPGADTFRASILRRVAAVAARSDLVWFRALTQDAMQTNAALLGIDPNRVFVIPRGVPADLIPNSPLSRAELGLPEAVPLVLNVGRQSAQKGHLHLLSAFQKVLAHNPAHLAIIGREGEVTPRIRAAISERGLEDAVTVVGYTPTVGHYYSHASVFAFPSLMEGLGTAVLEAMAAKIPVVAFAIPPVIEATDGGRLAHLVSTGDEDGIAKGILEAMSGGLEIAARVEEAQAWVRREFSTETVSKRLLERLREVVTLG